MKKYFIHDGQQQIGPFSAADLIERGIASCTPVFTTGLGRYVIASEIPVLNEAFVNKLNGLKKVTNEVSIKEIKKSDYLFFKRIGLVFVALVIIIVPFAIYKIQVGIPDVPLSAPVMKVQIKQDVVLLKTALAEKESANPLQYIVAHGKMHNNLLGKKIIRGIINNMAAIAIYKNIQMAVIFLSANETELQTQQFIVNDFVNPNNKISFRNVFIAPPETAGFKLKVLSASAMP